MPRLQLFLYILLLIEIHVVLCVVESGSGVTINEQLCGSQKGLLTGCSHTTKCVLWGVVAGWTYKEKMQRVSQNFGGV